MKIINLLHLCCGLLIASSLAACENRGESYETRVVNNTDSEITLASMPARITLKLQPHEDRKIDLKPSEKLQFTTPQSKGQLTAASMPPPFQWSGGVRNRISFVSGKGCLLETEICIRNLSSIDKNWAKRKTDQPKNNEPEVVSVNDQTLAQGDKACLYGLETIIQQKSNSVTIEVLSLRTGETQKIPPTEEKWIPIDKILEPFE